MKMWTSKIQAQERTKTQMLVLMPIDLSSLGGNSRYVWVLQLVPLMYRILPGTITVMCHPQIVKTCVTERDYSTKLK